MNPEQAANPLMQMVPFMAIFLIFYLLVIKPEKTKQNERKARIANLQKNDQVVTSGGLHGTVVNVKATTVVIRVDDAVKIEVDKEAIARVTE